MKYNTHQRYNTNFLVPKPNWLNEFATPTKIKFVSDPPIYYYLINISSQQPFSFSNVHRIQKHCQNRKRETLHATAAVGIGLYIIIYYQYI